MPSSFVPVHPSQFRAQPPTYRQRFRMSNWALLMYLELQKNSATFAFPYQYPGGTIPTAIPHDFYARANAWQELMGLLVGDDTGLRIALLRVLYERNVLSEQQCLFALGRKG